MNAIVTVTVGDHYQKIAKLSHPTFQAYADRIGAEFGVLPLATIKPTSPSWEKMRVAELLGMYERVMYIDSDAIISPECPDLFKIVPRGKFGAFNEGRYIYRGDVMEFGSRQYGIKIDGWERSYYNAGVLVADQNHKDLFRLPPQLHENYYEQTYLNLRIFQTQTEVHDFTTLFNRMCHFDWENRSDSFIIHYAGGYSGLMEGDLKKWAVI